MGNAIKKDVIHAEGIDIGVYTSDYENEFISLTDIAKKKEGEYPGYVIQNWMRNRSEISFIGLWEALHNPNFNCLEFEAIKNEAGDNGFVMTPKRWIESTGAIGIISKQGRYAATFAHRDIAFEFASWISPEFKLQPWNFWEQGSKYTTQILKWLNSTTLKQKQDYILLYLVRKYSWLSAYMPCMLLLSFWNCFLKIF